jgi:hypothetical protein
LRKWEVPTSPDSSLMTSFVPNPVTVTVVHVPATVTAVHVNPSPTKPSLHAHRPSASVPSESQALHSPEERSRAVVALVQDPAILAMGLVNSHYNRTFNDHQVGCQAGQRAMFGVRGAK